MAGFMERRSRVGSSSRLPGGDTYLRRRLLAPKSKVPFVPCVAGCWRVVDERVSFCLSVSIRRFLDSRGPLLARFR